MGLAAFIIFLVGVIPFLVFLNIFPFGGLAAYWLSSTVVLGAAFVGLVQSRGGLRCSRLHCGLGLGLIGLLLVSAAAAAPAEDVRGLLIYAVVVFAAALLASAIAESGKGYYVKLAWVMLAGGCIQAICALALHYGLLPVVGRWMPPAGTRMTGLLAQPNLLALYLFLSFISLCYLYSCRQLSSSLAVVLGLLLGVVLAGTGSRAALVYSGMACLAVLVPKALLSQDKLKLCSMFILLWLCIPLYLLLDTVLQPVMESLGYIDRLATIDSSRDYSTFGFRLSEWRKSAIMFLQHPFTGVGIGNYGVNSFWMGVEYPWAITEGSFPTHSHNAIAPVAAEFGVLGLLLAIAAVLLLSGKMLRMEKTAQWWLVASACSAFLVNAMLEYALWDLHFAVLFVFFAAPVFGCIRAIKLSKYVVATVVLGLGLAWGSLSLGMLDMYAKAVRYGDGVHDDLQAMDLKVAGDDFLLGRDMQLLYALNVLPQNRDLDFYDGLTQRLVAWRPLNIVLLRRMQVAALKGDDAQVMRMAHAIARFYPKDLPKLRHHFSQGSGAANAAIVKALDAQSVRHD